MILYLAEKCVAAGWLIVVCGEIVVIKLKRCGSRRHLHNRIL